MNVYFDVNNIVFSICSISHKQFQKNIEKEKEEESEHSGSDLDDSEDDIDDDIDDDKKVRICFMSCHWKYVYQMSLGI